LALTSPFSSAPSPIPIHAPTPYSSGSECEPEG